MAWRGFQCWFWGPCMQNACTVWETMNFMHIHEGPQAPFWWLDLLSLLTVSLLPPGAKTPIFSCMVLIIDTGDGSLYRNNTLKLFPRKASLSWQQLPWQLSLLEEDDGHWSMETNPWVILLRDQSDEGIELQSPHHWAFPLPLHWEGTSTSQGR